MTPLTNAEIDRRTALLMGWHEGKDPMHYQPCWNDENEKCAKLQRDWHPSTDLNQAWQVVESKSVNCVHVQIFRTITFYTVNLHTLDNLYTASDTTSLPRAICLACIQVADGMKCEWGDENAELDPFDRKYESD
jgi:hypothetical protein